VGQELIPHKTLLPRVEDEDGNKLEGPEMERVLGKVTEFAQLAQLAHIRMAAERPQVQGRTYPLILNVTDVPQWFDTRTMFPYVPFARVEFYNQGSNEWPVYITVNTQYDWNLLLRYDTLPIDYSQADERIHLIGYRCDPSTGNTGTVRMTAHY
jgi:hypothetical protein